MLFDSAESVQRARKLEPKQTKIKTDLGSASPQRVLHANCYWPSLGRIPWYWTTHSLVMIRATLSHCYPTALWRWKCNCDEVVDYQWRSALPTSTLWLTDRCSPNIPAEIINHRNGALAESILSIIINYASTYIINTAMIL